jgi:hypothetical protein
MSPGLRFTAALAAGLLVATAAAAPAAAQSSATASISAVAHVSGVPPLQARGVTNLDFGTVTNNETKTVTQANAGRFDITGQPTGRVSVSFPTLPTVLTGAGNATIPILFNATDGLYWSVFPGTPQSFDPRVPYTANIDAQGRLVIGIVGTVQVPATATTGDYSGTITLQVAYF